MHQNWDQKQHVRKLLLNCEKISASCSYELDSHKKKVSVHWLVHQSVCPSVPLTTRMKINARFLIVTYSWIPIEKKVKTTFEGFFSSTLSIYFYQLCSFTHLGEVKMSIFNCEICGKNVIIPSSDVIRRAGPPDNQ